MVSSIIKSVGLGMLLAGGIVGGAYLLDRLEAVSWDWLSVSMMTLAVLLAFLLFIPSSSSSLLGPRSPWYLMSREVAEYQEEQLSARQRDFRWLLVASPLIVSFFIVLYLSWGSI